MSRPRKQSHRKLVLVVVDSLRADMLLSAVSRGDAPTFKQLLDRGELIEECVSSFPSVTPVCTSEILTGERPDRHLIPGMNWFHRAEGRYVEYGSSFEATRTFGLFSSLYDTVYNLNMRHLNFETPTLYEQLADAGLRSAATPFLIYRGRTRHETGLDGILRAFAQATGFHHAVWGPDELFYGELYSSRRVDARPTLARPATRDAYSAAAGRVLVEEDLYDFLLYSLPDNDFYSHRDGPKETYDAIGMADDALHALAEAHGGIGPFLEQNAVIVVSDHAQSDVGRELDLQGALGERWRVLQPNEEAGEAEIAVGPSGRGAGVWILDSSPPRPAAVRASLLELAAVELIAWKEDGRAHVRRGDAELELAPAAADDVDVVHDLRGVAWELTGAEEALGLTRRGTEVSSVTFPDALARIWAALANPNAADVLVSLAPGYECVDWGGATHVPGGSHGSLRAEDSTAMLLMVGIDGGVPRRRQWAISDVAEVVLEHFGIGKAARSDTPDDLA